MTRNWRFGAAVVILVAAWAVPDCIEAAASPEVLYQRARAEYHSLHKSSEKRKYRANWLRCIQLYDAIYQSFPRSDRADDALYMMGILYEELSRYSGQRLDVGYAISAYQRLTALYPASRYADDGQFRIGVIHRQNGDYELAYVNFSKVIKRFPNGDMTGKAREELARLKDYGPSLHRLVEVRGIRHWSSPEYTRVVIDLEGETDFEDHLLRPDPEAGKPPRLYVDIRSSRISRELKQPIPIQDGLLIKARAAQHTKDVVRVVLDMESLSTYRTFPLKDPSRIIIDVQGNGSRSSPSDDGGNRGSKKPSLARQLGLGVRRVVIDPGHGGKDPGAIGPGGLREKDVVLKIAKKLERKLQKDLGLETILTRRDDRFVPLDERTAIANTKKADLFVSIHANATRRSGARGIETYVLNLSNDQETIALAARENAVSEKKLSDLQYILYDLMRTAKINESRTLAERTQESIYRRLRVKYSGVRNLGVKEAPFYVLIGANMPCILVEVSFISNKIEEKRLEDDRYLDELAAGITEGIARYMRSMGA